MKDTTARKIVLINKVRKIVEKEGYQFATTGKSAPAARCPVCGKPSLIRVMKQGADIRTSRILGFCFNRLAKGDAQCKSTTLVVREDLEYTHAIAK